MKSVLTDVSGVNALQTERGQKTDDEPLAENFITTLLGDVTDEYRLEVAKRVGARRQWLKNKLDLDHLVVPREYTTHGIVLIDGQTIFEPDEFLVPTFKADSLWTKTPRIGLAVSTADCGGVLVADTTQPLVAAIHSGHAQSMRALPYRTIKQLPANPKNLKAYVSPTAAAESYEVDLPFKDKFIAYFRRHFQNLELDIDNYFVERELTIWLTRDNDQPTKKMGISFDNQRLIVDQLLASGIFEENIVVDTRNTMDPKNNLHSYRLDGFSRDESGNIVGRKPASAQLSVIGLQNVR